MAKEVEKKHPKQEGEPRSRYKGPPEKLAKVMCKHITQPNFIKETRKQSGSLVVVHKEFWLDLHKIQDNFSFTKAMIKKALAIVVKTNNAKLAKPIPDNEIDDWKNRMSKRVAKQARFIAQTKQHNPKCTWLKILLDPSAASGSKDVPGPFKIAQAAGKAAKAAADKKGKKNGRRSKSR